MEDILAIILIFGGGTAIAISFSPIGRAIADRIRYGKEAPPELETDPAVYEELDVVRTELEELRERLDFNERLISKRDGSEVPPPAGESQ